MSSAKRDTTPESSDDHFGRIDYRSLIAWSPRIQREWPFLKEHLEAAPEASVVDVGCGTGEHSAFLAEQGFRTLGIDSSQAQIQSARDHENTQGDNGPRFVQGDVAQLPDLVPERFGAAVCLGNVLPYLEDDELDAALAALHRSLLPGGGLIVQILNYHRILDGSIDHLPVNVRSDPDGGNEVVFVRVFRPDPPAHVLFYPITLGLKPGQDPPLELCASREIRVRAWLWPELEQVLARHEFVGFQLFGSVTGDAFDAESSHDLIFVARLRAP